MKNKPRVLVIDDEPIRAENLLSVCDLRIAHGFEQIKFWLRNTHWRPQYVFLDNDMPLMKGIDVARIFGLDLVGIPVTIWSMNTNAAKEISAILEDLRFEEIVWLIRIEQFNPHLSPQKWSEIISRYII